MKRATILLLPLILVGGGFFLISCSKEPKEKEANREVGEPGMPADWKFTLPPGDPIEGRKIFVKVGCYKCHEIKGETFAAVAEGGRGVGPELSQLAGTDPVEFFAESIIAPNAVIEPEDAQKGYLGEDGKSKMPDYNDVLTIKQVSDLATYLASLKGERHITH